MFPGLGAMRGVDALGVGQVLSLVFVNRSSSQSSGKGVVSEVSTESWMSVRAAQNLSGHHFSLLKSDGNDS